MNDADSATADTDANSATNATADSAADFAATVRRLAAYSTESSWQGEVFHFTLERQHALRLTGIDRPLKGTLTAENSLAIYDGDDVASYNANATTTCIARLAESIDEAAPQQQHEPDGDGEIEPDARPGDAPTDERAQTALFADTTPEEAAQENLEMLLRQRREAAGIDDRADGLPTIEEARTLVSSLARVVGNADGDVVTLQDALRRIATNSPNRLFAPPIFPALVKLRLDDRPEWSVSNRCWLTAARPGLPRRCAGAMTR